jgi:N-[(2S)-2-amino-2-carboxyethyl]-L-glutamate dehydrogenase
VPTMTMLTSADVARQVDGRRAECVDLVERAYLTHDAGQSVNPHSGFLRFPGSPESRVIALPAWLGGEFGVAGIKWVASFPGNTARGLPRASALMVLNDVDTGFPYACLESSIISATRTAASAVLAAEHLLGRRAARRVGIIGAGLINRHVHRFLTDLGWRIGEYRLFDTAPGAAERFAAELGANARVVDDVAGAVDGCDLVVIATVAGVPHIHDRRLFAHRPVVLHLSLRDLAPEIILAAQNITDDLDHVLREQTSLHLTEQRCGDRLFVAGTIADVLRGRLARDTGRATIFSPFGLGILDLAVGQSVFRRAVAAGHGNAVPDFFTAAMRPPRTATMSGGRDD